MTAGWCLWLAIALTACTPAQPTVIDGSSPDAFSRTVEAARRDLSDADRLDYDRAINSIGARRFGAGDKAALARTTFDGLTAEQVVADYRARQR